MKKEMNLIIYLQFFFLSFIKNFIKMSLKGLNRKKCSLFRKLSSFYLMLRSSHGEITTTILRTMHDVAIDTRSLSSILILAFDDLILTLALTLITRSQFSFRCIET